MKHGFYGEGQIPIQRGKVVEEQMLGKVQKRSESPGPWEGGPYVNFGDAVRAVKSGQPFHPENPGTPFAKELRIELLDLLKLETQEDFSRLRFYTAVESALDKFHGIDAFFEYDELEGYNRITSVIKIDVTTNDKDLESSKSDIVIRVPDNGIDEDEKEFYPAVSRVARAVFERIKNNSGPAEIIDLRY